MQRSRVPRKRHTKENRQNGRLLVAKQLVNKAASGDPKFISVLLNEARQHEAGSATATGPNVLCRPEDQLVMANIVKRIRETEVTEVTTPATSSESSADNLKTDTSQPKSEGKS